jgi:hypothetical protein
LDRAQALAGGIASGYASDILKGQPVKYVTGGVIQVAAAGDAFAGAFAGVEFTDTTGRRPCIELLACKHCLPDWFMRCLLLQLILIVYEIQADGTLAQTAIGDEADLKHDCWIERHWSVSCYSVHNSGWCWQQRANAYY